MRFYPVVTFLGGRATFYNFFPEENYYSIPNRPNIQTYPPVEGKDVHEAAAKWSEKRFMPYDNFVFSEEKTVNGKHLCTSFMVKKNEERKQNWH